jgi:Holliday junction DNA helicase RuvA
MSILSACPLERIGFAIASGDVTALRQAEGVGPKLATRIVTELKDKVSKLDMTPPKKGTKTVVAGTVSESSVDHDAVSALVNLGYTRADAYQAVLQARTKSNDNNDLNIIIKLALKELAS